MSEATPALQRPLEEVMLAMDVVDTLRHRENLVSRELNEEARDRQLIERLREIYASQGIEVADEVLAEGVKALKDQRFVYRPPEPGLSVTLARVYVRRRLWGGAVLTLAAVLVASWAAWHWFVTLPGERRAEALELELAEFLPNRIKDLGAEIESISEVDEARRIARSLQAEAQSALAERNPEPARTAVASLQALRDRLAQEYALRVVSRPGATSGVWRIPDANPQARNYYVIVEALDRELKPVSVMVSNEESGESSPVTQWGVRVPAETFNKIRRDKEDDGIIQNDILGVKRRGTLEPDYNMPVSGGTITTW